MEFLEAKESEITIDKTKRVLHGDGWGYELTLRDDESFMLGITYLEYDNEKEEYVATKQPGIEITTLIVRRLAEEILEMLPKKEE